jgi:hypothetical protein
MQDSIRLDRVGLHCSGSYYYVYIAGRRRRTKVYLVAHRPLVGDFIAGYASTE